MMKNPIEAYRLGQVDLNDNRMALIQLSRT